VVKKLKWAPWHPLHTPIFWATLAVITVIFLPEAANYTLVGLLIVLAHLLTDLITARTAGIPIFYPLSKKEYSLVKTNKSWGKMKPTNVFSQRYKKYIYRYFQNKKLIAFEGMIILVGIYSLYLINP